MRRSPSLDLRQSLAKEVPEPDGRTMLVFVKVLPLRGDSNILSKCLLQFRFDQSLNKERVSKCSSGELLYRE